MLPAGELRFPRKLKDPFFIARVPSLFTSLRTSGFFRPEPVARKSARLSSGDERRYVRFRGVKLAIVAASRICDLPMRNGVSGTSAPFPVNLIFVFTSVIGCGNWGIRALTAERLRV